MTQNFTITVEDLGVERLFAAWGQGWQPTIIDAQTTTEIPNPQSLAEYARQQVIAAIKSRVTEYEAKKLREQADGVERDGAKINIT